MSIDKKKDYDCSLTNPHALIVGANQQTRVRK